VSLQTALVDRARQVSETPTGEKVEGSTIFQTSNGPWFKVRLTMSPAPEADDPQAGRRRVPHPGTILCGVKDADGGAVTISSADRLWVNSKELGDALYEITSDGEPIRKRRKLIGWMANITRLEEHPFTPAEL
jgi:hypothetical protein